MSSSVSKILSIVVTSSVTPGFGVTTTSCPLGKAMLVTPPSTPPTTNDSKTPSTQSLPVVKLPEIVCPTS